jgi:hypothetical protein
MATNQSPTVRPTAFPEDIEVGKDGLRVAVMSNEILAFGVQRSPFGGGGSAFARGSRFTASKPTKRDGSPRCECKGSL